MSSELMGLGSPNIMQLVRKESPNEKWYMGVMGIIENFIDSVHIFEPKLEKHVRCNEHCMIYYVKCRITSDCENALNL